MSKIMLPEWAYEPIDAGDGEILAFEVEPSPVGDFDTMVYRTLADAVRAFESWADELEPDSDRFKPFTAQPVRMTEAELAELPRLGEA